MSDTRNPQTPVRASVARCGTPSGYSRHQALSERPCDACVAAKALYDARYHASPERARRNRINARAQAKAHGELTRRHKAEYDELYAQWKARLRADAVEQP